jgi:hypothetical protein
MIDITETNEKINCEHTRTCTATDSSKHHAHLSHPVHVFNTVAAFVHQQTRTITKKYHHARLLNNHYHTNLLKIHHHSGYLLIAMRLSQRSRQPGLQRTDIEVKNDIAFAS